MKTNREGLTKVQYLEIQIKKKYPSLYSSVGGQYVFDILSDIYGRSKRNQKKMIIT